MLISKIFDNAIEANANELMETLKCAKAGSVPKFETNFVLDLAMCEGKSLSNEEEKRFYMLSESFRETFDISFFLLKSYFVAEKKQNLLWEN